jgi:hypothetical protein
MAFAVSDLNVIWFQALKALDRDDNAMAVALENINAEDPSLFDHHPPTEKRMSSACAHVNRVEPEQRISAVGAPPLAVVAPGGPAKLTPRPRVAGQALAHRENLP